MSVVTIKMNNNLAFTVLHTIASDLYSKGCMREVINSVLCINPCPDLSPGRAPQLDGREQSAVIA